MANYKTIAYTGGNMFNLTGGSGEILIKKIEASSDSTISFVNGTDGVVFDNTFRNYKITYISVHPGNDNVFLSFNVSIDTGSNYNVNKTTNFTRAQHGENGAGQTQAYDDSSDLATGSGFQVLENGNSNDNDHASSGYMYLFNPSDTTFMKSFLSQTNCTSAGNFTIDNRVGGTFETSSAIDAIQFKFSGGNIDSGIFKLYGVL